MRKRKRAPAPATIFLMAPMAIEKIEGTIMALAERPRQFNSFGQSVRELKVIGAPTECEECASLREFIDTIAHHLGMPTGDTEEAILARVDSLREMVKRAEEAKAQQLLKEAIADHHPNCTECGKPVTRLGAPICIECVSDAQDDVQEAQVAVDPVHPEIVCPECGGTSWGGGTDADPRPWCNKCGAAQPGWKTTP